MGTSAQPTVARQKRRYILLLLLLPLVGAASVPFASEHLRAASLLLRIQDASDQSWLAKYGTYSVREASFELPLEFGRARGRTYTPDGVADPPRMVVVHGVHRLGIDEPRLTAFSRALCASGIEVFTPEVAELADYRVSQASLDVIGNASTWYGRQSGKRVGLLGLSFAGGEALMVAADPRFSESISFVVSIGGHESMRRVAEFYVTGRTARPDGTIVGLNPHEYGALVLVYSHLEEFFPVDEIPKVQNALRLLLWEQVEDSKAAARDLKKESFEKMDKIYRHDRGAISQELEIAIGKHVDEMEKVSPRGKLKSLAVPVLLLHGAGDDVIPATELEWLQQQVPKHYLRGALATPLLSHVSIAGEPPLQEKWALLNFMAELMQLTDESTAAKLGN